MPNCYGYAMGIEFVTNPGLKGGYSVVSNWSDGFETAPWTPELRARELIQACLSDGLIGWNTSKGEFLSKPIPGKKVIAAFIHRYVDCVDFHFIRQDKDGSWSMKDSNTGPITGGFRDPVVQDAKLVGQTLVSGKVLEEEFVAYFEVPPALAITEAWEE